MVLAIRDVQEHDLGAVLALNNAAQGGVSALDGNQLQQLFDSADYFRVAEMDGHLAGFLIALRETNTYPERHFQWFQQRHERFVYVDRIVVANAYRRHGLGRVFYCDVQSYAEPRVPMLACAVQLEPRNDVAILFHGTYGFQEVGQFLEPDDIHHTGMLGKTLDSYAFVCQRYGPEETDLPTLPWLGSRHTRPPATDLSGNRCA